MKTRKILYGLFIGLLPVMLLGCTGAPPAPTNGAATSPLVASGATAGMDLDAAIREAAAQMEARIPAGTMVALVSVASSSAQLSEYVISRLEAAVVSGGKLVVVDRANLDRVREEQGFQLSGEVDDNSAKAIGRLLGAGAIVTGAFVNLGDVYSLALKAINIETATVAVSYPADIARSTRIETLLASGGGAAGMQTAQRGTASGSTTAPAAPSAPIYKIGDTGPAGGIIFYDKGNSSGGWRYLEAAPVETEFMVTWAPPGRTNSYSRDDDDAIGKGLSNTRAIVAYFTDSGGGFNSAAWECNDLVINGFDDWFLPSQSELSYMYGNLQRKGLGGFAGTLYWCSSQVLNSSGGLAIACVNFADGEQNYASHRFTNSEKYRVRAARQF